MDVAVATNFVDKIELFPHLVVRMTFARAAPPAQARTCDGALLTEVF